MESLPVETVKDIYHHHIDKISSPSLTRCSCFLHTVDKRYINPSILRDDPRLNSRNCCFYDDAIELVIAQS